MKAYLQKLCGSAKTPLIAQHHVREYLQARILQSLQCSGAMQSIAFHGGTALRFLYEIPRYSEDLDFTLERVVSVYDFRKYLHQIEQDFVAEAYALDFKVTTNKLCIRLLCIFAVCSMNLGFRRINPKCWRSSWRLTQSPHLALYWPQHP